jgi:hypothetical protein
MSSLLPGLQKCNNKLICFKDQHKGYKDSSVPWIFLDSSPFRGSLCPLSSLLFRTLTNWNHVLKVLKDPMHGSLSLAWGLKSLCRIHNVFFPPCFPNARQEAKRFRKSAIVAKMVLSSGLSGPESCGGYWISSFPPVYPPKNTPRGDNVRKVLFGR